MDISIIIPAYNCEKYIGRALRSTLDQAFERERYEVVVVNDGSKDDTKKILNCFKDQVRIFSFKKNMGLSYARNYAIRKALGKFIICLDADDYISNSLLSIEHLYLSCNSYIDAVSCDYFLINDKDEVIERRNAIECPIACGIMFYKDKLNDIGLYDESFLALEDSDLRKRYLEKFNIYNIPLPLYRYRYHAKNLTKKEKHMNYFKKRLYKKHKIEDLEGYLRNHENVKGAIEKC